MLCCETWNGSTPVITLEWSWISCWRSGYFLCLFYSSEITWHFGLVRESNISEALRKRLTEINGFSNVFIRNPVFTGFLIFISRQTWFARFQRRRKRISRRACSSFATTSSRHSSLINFIRALVRRRRKWKRWAMASITSLFSEQRVVQGSEWVCSWGDAYKEEFWKSSVCHPLEVLFTLALCL